MAASNSELNFRQRFMLTALIGWRALVSPVAFGAAGLCLNREGRVLLVEHTYMPGWRLPGGGVERGEDPKKAVIRELEEEVALTSFSDCTLFDVISRRIGFATNVVALYLVRDAELAFVPNREIRAIVFADPANPPDGTPKSTRNILARLAKALSSAST